MTVVAYRDRKAGLYPVFTSAIRDQSDVLFGDEPPQEVLDKFGLDPVQAVAPPSYDPAQKVLREGVPELVNDHWRQTWVVSNIPAPDDAAVNAERDRRLSLGITFQSHTFQTDPDSRERIDRSRISAMAAIMGGVQPGDLRWHGLAVDFFWIAADDTRIPMDAQTMVAFGNAMAAREGLLIVAGNDIKKRLAAGEAIANIGDNSLWPV